MKTLTCFFSVLVMASFTQAQNFATPQINSYSLKVDGARTSPAFVDIDDDDDLDLFTGIVSGDFGFFENTGTSNSPLFGTRSLNTFGIQAVSGNSTPFFIDLDNDKDFDLLAGHGSSGMKYYENEGNGRNPSFKKGVDSPFLLNGPSGINKPYFADIDGDDDMDLFVGSSDGNTYYYRNIGTVSNPSFDAAVTNPFGLTDVGDRSAPSFADLDNDNDLDAFIGSRDGNTYFFKNTGSSTSPTFTPTGSNPFNIKSVGKDAKPYFGDLDSDGDMDLMVGNAAGDYHYFENVTSSSVVNIIHSIGVTIYPNPVIDNTTIQFEGLPNDEWKLKITDITGSVILKANLLNQDLKITITKEDLSKGMFFAYLEGNNQKFFVGKLLVQ
jgi:large repetitive protein